MCTGMSVYEDQKHFLVHLYDHTTKYKHPTEYKASVAHGREQDIGGAGLLWYCIERGYIMSVGLWGN